MHVLITDLRLCISITALNSLLIAIHTYTRKTRNRSQIGKLVYSGCERNIIVKLLDTIMLQRINDQIVYTVCQYGYSKQVQNAYSTVD
jgi:hypothetical protein